jgi:hypothetical protein
MEQPFVIVEGAVPAGAVGATCQLRDDDDNFLAQYGVPQPLPMGDNHSEIVQGITKAYSVGFILPVDATALGLNPRTNISFHLNEPAASFGFASVFDDSKDISDRSSFWAHLISFGYQSLAGQDADPDNEDPVLGANVEDILGNSSGYCAIYVESIRDVKWQDTAFGMSLNPGISESVRRLYWHNLFVAVAHEVGHSPGEQNGNFDHGEGGIMQSGGPFIDLGGIPASGIIELDAKFSAITVRRFRTCSSWAD